jgi:hypothetical protein
MKPNTLTIFSAMQFVTTSVLTFIGMVNFSLAGEQGANPTSQPNKTVSSRIVLIDDQSGPELADEGVLPLSVEAMESLVTESLESRDSVFLAHVPVDDDGSDNPVAEFAVEPYPAGAAPTGPSTSLPREELRKAMAEYQPKRQEWMRGFREYRKTTDGRSEAFLAQVMRHQLEINQRMDRILQERRGKDFRRSDLVGAIVRAAKLLGPGGERFLVLNSDCIDEPGKREPRRTPLTPAELDSGIVLLFVNSTGNPQKSVLFRGLKNPVIAAPDLPTAFRLVFKGTKVQNSETGQSSVPQAVTQ